MKKIIGIIFFLNAALILLPGEIINFPFTNRLFFGSDFEGNNELYLLGNNRLTRLTNHSAKDLWPIPDSKGERIVFISDRNGNFDVYLMDLKSRAITQLTSDPGDEFSPSWSFDDRFVYYDVGGGGMYFTMKKEISTGKVSKLFSDPPFSSTIVCFQNHRGDEIFFTGKVLLGWVVAKYQLDSQKYFELASKGGSCRPKISPDDRKIAYVSGEDDGLGDVWLMNSDGSEKTNLTKWRRHWFDYYPCFSPDGQMVVFSSSPEAKGKKGYDLFRIDLKTKKIKLVFQSPGNDVDPYWCR